MRYSVNQGWFFSLLFFLLLWFSNAAAADSTLQALQTMRASYLEYQALQTDDSLPFMLESSQGGGAVKTSVRTFLPGIPFQLLAQRLSDVTQWCEFIPLHLNVKACSYRIDDQGEGAMLDFYLGPKGYATPDEVRVLNLGFAAQRTSDLLTVQFDAPTGPLGSSNYDFQFRAIGVGNDDNQDQNDNEGVYLEFELSSNPGLASGLVRLYFATAGSRKVGFSIKSRNSRRIKYVKGQRGGAERNIVRYLFSVQAYFDTIDQEHRDDVYQLRLQRWFDLTQLHKKQLYELSRADYLRIKQKERINQIKLLDAIARGVPPEFSAEK